MTIFLLALIIWVLSLTPVYAQEPAQLSSIIKVIQSIIRLLVPVAAIAFLVTLIIGGFKFVTSGGDPKEVASARSTLTFGVIGIVLVVASWLILLLVQTVTGFDVTTVNLPI